MRDRDELSTADRRTRVFISYSRRDTDIVDRLSACLETRAITPLIDRREILVGEPWQDRLGSMLVSSDAVVLAVSPDSVGSPICLWELSEALRLGKRLVPVLVRPVPDETLPIEIRRIHFLRLEADLEAVADSIGQVLDTDIEWIRERTRLYELALRWRDKGSTSALLLRSKELAGAEEWLGAMPAGETIGDAIEALLAASRLDATQRNRAVNAAILASNDTVASLAHRFQNQEGIPAQMIIDGLRNAETMIAGIADRDTHPDLVRTLGFILAELSTTLLAQNSPTEALAAAERAHEVFNSLAARFPDERARQADCFVGVDRLADALAACGRESEAAAFRRQSFALARGGAEAFPEDPIWQDHLAVALEKTAGVAALAGNLEAARLDREHAERIRNALTIAAPEDPVRRRDHATALEVLADTHLALGDYEKAVATYRASLDLTRSIAGEDERRTDWQRELAIANQRIGDALAAGGDPMAALPLYEQDVAIILRLAETDPRNVRWQLDVLKSLDRVARLYLRIGDAEASRAAFRRGLAMACRLAESAPLAADWRAVAAFTQNLCSAALSAGEPATAAVEAQACASTLEGEPEGNPGRIKRLARALSNAAWFSLLAGRTEEALPLSARAFNTDPTDPEVALNRIHALVLSGALDEAAALLTRGLAQHPGWPDSIARDLDQLSQHGVCTDALRTLVATVQGQAT